MSFELYTTGERNDTKSAIGAVIKLTDCSDKKLHGLTIYGKTTQNGTPSLDAPVALDSVGNGGSVTVKVGTSATDANPQTLTVSTPNGLPGIPVSSGGNYTDENGQQWICDEVDFARGKYVQRVVNVISKLTKYQDLTYYSAQDLFFIKSDIGGFKEYADYGLSTHYQFSTDGLSNMENGTFKVSNNLYINDSNLNTDTRPEYFEWMKENLSILVEIATPIETDLSAEQLASYSALHTNKPNTTIYSNSNAELKVTYATSVQLYSERYELRHAISTIMTLYYNDIGKIVLVAPVDDYNIAALKVGNLLYDTDRDVTFIIANTKIETDTNRITANGYTANWILNKRCIASKYTLTNLESGVYNIINENMRGLENLNTAAVEGLKERTNTILHGGQIFDEIQPFLEEAELGNKMIWDPETLCHTFKIYKGADLTEGIHAIVFSDEQGTAQDLVINDDDSTLKNFAYVKGQLKDNTDFVETVGTATGDNRREVWFETSVTQEADESVADCKERAIAYATMELGKRIRRQSFSVAIDASELGVMYNLGDIVSCVSIRFGVSFNARIKGIKYTLDNRKTKTEIILGDPILTALGEMKLNG